MKKVSIWLQNNKKWNFPSLEKEISCDILIIGGGLTGVCSAYNIKNSGKEIILIEQNKMGFGVSGHTTGKITYLQEDILEKIKKKYDEETAYKYLDSQKKYMSFIKDIIVNENIDCDLVTSDSYLFVFEDKNKKKLDIQRKFIKDYQDEKELPAKAYSVDAFKVSDSYLFHPIKYFRKI
jgi:glycine/D-amino acid oxidase-like deaminating enzyme